MDEQPKPGTTISPGQNEGVLKVDHSSGPAEGTKVPTSASPAQTQPAQKLPEKPKPAATENPGPPTPATTPSAPAKSPQPPKDTAQNANDNLNTPEHNEDNLGSVSWTASEYIAHHKSAGWYIALIVAAAALAVLVWFVTKDKVSTGVIAISAIALAAYGSRKPRQLQYGLDEAGFTIGTKRHPYEQFRSFSIVQEGAFSNIVLMPLKRFAPLTSLYYDPQDEAKIMPILSKHLPLENHKHDLIDKFMHQIRF